MIFAKQSIHKTARFRTRARVALTASVFALLVVALSSSGCNRTSETGGKSARANANQPSAPTVTVRRGTEAGKGGPLATDALPDGVLQEEVKTLDGKSLRLGDYAGKVVVLDIWATWCGPCRREIPHLVELSKEYEGRGVEVIGLTTEDPVRDAEAVREFAREFNINYTLGWIGEDLYMTLTRGQNVIPQTFVIGRDGRVIRHIRGFSPQIASILREAIERGISTSGA